ncbi:unnamed protein product [Haemonchus placei]|uniref:Uncharacterized protein n=1 Tax=Haemonchus placei TaxID=6290 RepID=A0A0N4WEE6_HAEPC|nr:unnamed protein product [Haemonchus placei]
MMSLELAHLFSKGPQCSVEERVHAEKWNQVSAYPLNGGGAALIQEVIKLRFVSPANHAHIHPWFAALQWMTSLAAGRHQFTFFSFGDRRP